MLHSTPLSFQHILLADDDDDDCFLFKYALKELPLTFALTIVNNGEELIRLLNEKTGQLPDIVFLDLNMPRKNGIECLSAIKSNEKLKQLPVIVFSTFISPEVVGALYKKGAQYCIRKPTTVSRLKEVIYEALIVVAQQNISPLPAERFELSQEFYRNEYN